MAPTPPPTSFLFLGVMFIFVCSPSKREKQVFLFETKTTTTAAAATAPQLLARFAFGKYLGKSSSEDNCCIQNTKKKNQKHYKINIYIHVEVSVMGESGKCVN